MGREAPQQGVARLRIAGTEAARLQKLSASSAASPPNSPTKLSTHSRRALLGQAGGNSACTSSMHGTKVEAWQLAQAPGGERDGGGNTAAAMPAGAWGLSDGPAAAAPTAHGGSTIERAPGGLQGGASHRPADSLGGASDEADPRLLQMLASTLPAQGGGSSSGQEEEEDAAAATLPATIAKLNALNGRPRQLGASPAGAAVEEPATAAAAAAVNGHAGKQQNGKRGSFFGSLFHRPGSAGKKQQQQQQQEAGAMRLARTESSESSGGSGGSGGKLKKKKEKKKKSSWFGGSSGKPAEAAEAPRSAGQRDAVGGGTVLLPGLPLTELAGDPRNGSGHSMGLSRSSLGTSSSASRSAGGSTLAAEQGSAAGAAAAAAAAAGAGAGTPATANGLAAVGGAHPAVASYAVAGYTDISDVSALSSAQPSPAVPSLGLPPDVDFAAGGKKGSHRRHRSITSMLLNPSGWRRRSRTASAGSEAEIGEDAARQGYAGGSYGSSRTGSPAPKLAEGLAAAAAAAGGSYGSYGSCFGLPSRHGEGEMVGMPPRIAEEPLLPAGITGIRNIGNTCFINAALQCLRYTPGLPLRVAPDILERAQEAQQQQQLQRADSSGGPASNPASPAALSALARAGSGSGGGAGLRPQQQQQQQQAGAAGDGVEGKGKIGGEEDVHLQALARVSVTAAAPAPPQLGDASSSCAQEAATAAEGASAPDAAGEAGSQQVAPDAGTASSEQGQDAQAQQQPQPQQPQQQQLAGRPPRPPKGALLESFAEVVRDLYVPPPGSGSAVCAAPLLRTLRAFPIAADYFDGGQHDCQEVLRVLMDLLHDDLNRVQRPASAQQQQQQQQVPDAAATGEGAAGEGAQAEQGDASQQAAPTSAEEEASAAAAAAAHPPGAAAAGSEPAGGAEGADAGAGHEAQLQAQQQEQQQAADQAEQQAEQQQPGPRAEPGTEEQKQRQEAGEKSGDGDGDDEEEEEDKDEAAKANRIWRQHLERDSSLITDLFGGQLQSSVTCHKCGERFTMYEPFWDLSLPLVKEGKSGGGFSWLGLRGTPASIQDCLTAFTADEKLEGAEAFHCEKCGEKTPATKHLRVHRFPEVLVLQIKRFKYKGASTDKLTASVSFPLKELRLHQFASPECPAGPVDCCYDLFAVSNHYGNLSGGHYTAMCRVPQPGGEGAWYSFNDDQVTRVNPAQVVSQYAYILFYVRRPCPLAAASAGASHHHRRNSSAASAGGV